MRENHAPHESLTGRCRKPSEAPTPRELDFVQALAGIQRDGRPGSTADTAAWLRVHVSTAATLRDRCIDRELVRSSGFGSTRKLSITDAGRQAIGEV